MEKISLTKLCQEYVLNIYETIHTKDIFYALTLAKQRTEIHDLILAKLGAERENGILEITNNLNCLNDKGKPFDVFKEHTKKELKETGKELKCRLELYCEKCYPNRIAIECITGDLENFTEGEIYFVFNKDNSYLTVVDDNGKKYGIDRELQLENDYSDFKICYWGRKIN